MPGQDLSLFGFLDDDQVEEYLQTYCILDGTEDPGALWSAAQQRLGDPIARAGSPEILDMPKAHKKYLSELAQTRRFRDTVRTIEWDFKVVEIDPLLAFQIHIGGARAEFHGADLPQNCSLKQLLPRCLPLEADRIELQPTETDSRSLTGTISLEAPTRNFLFLRGGYEAQPDQDQFVMGAFIGSAPPFVQVIRFDKRCYLTNGFHRLLSARRKGVTHIPCIFGDTKDFERTGAAQEGSLSGAILRGDNPPTVGHYAQGRATEVRLRRRATKISVTWEVTFPEIEP